MTDKEKITELETKCKELKKVLDRRPEARFARWVENIMFLLGGLIVIASAFEFPFLDISTFELSLAFVLVAAKLFGKTVAVDMVGKIFNNVGELAKAAASRKGKK